MLSCRNVFCIYLYTSAGTKELAVFADLRSDLSNLKLLHASIYITASPTTLSLRGLANMVNVAFAFALQRNTSYQSLLRCLGLCGRPAYTATRQIFLIPLFCARIWWTAGEVSWRGWPLSHLTADLLFLSLQVCGNAADQYDRRQFKGCCRLRASVWHIAAQIAQIHSKQQVLSVRTWLVLFYALHLLSLTRQLKADGRWSVGTPSFLVIYAHAVAFLAYWAIKTAVWRYHHRT